MGKREMPLAQTCPTVRKHHIWLQKNAMAEILVYNANYAPFFGGDFNHSTDIVSHDPSRKSFLAKLVGLVAVAGFAPRLLAKAQESSRPVNAAAVVSKFALRPDARAVARRSDSV